MGTIWRREAAGLYLCFNWRSLREPGTNPPAPCDIVCVTTAAGRFGSGKSRRGPRTPRTVLHFRWWQKKIPLLIFTRMESPAAQTNTCDLTVFVFHGNNIQHAASSFPTGHLKFLPIIALGPVDLQPPDKKVYCIYFHYSLFSHTDSSYIFLGKFCFF